MLGEVYPACKSMELTQYQKILTHMLRNKSKEWWLPQDFMQPHLGDLFVGYEASARLSELSKLYPEMMLARREGKFMARKLDLLAFNWYKNKLPADLAIIFENEYQGQASLFKL